MKHNRLIAAARRFSNRAKDVLFMSPFLPFWQRKLRGKVMVYLYHRIAEQGEHSFLDNGGSPLIGKDEFALDLALLKKFGAQFIRFSDIPTCGFDANKFYVVISVDDGFASNYEIGMKVAEQAGASLTIFQCSNMLLPGSLLWEHQLYYCYFHPKHGDAFRQQLKSENAWPSDLNTLRDQISPLELDRFMRQFVEKQLGLAKEITELASALYPSVVQLQQAQSRGHEIGSHGHNHYKRSNISELEFTSELSESKQILESVLDRSVATFSYPFNSYSDSDALLCARHYSMVATVDGGSVTQSTAMLNIPRNTHPGKAKTRLRQRRWLLTGNI